MLALIDGDILTYRIGFASEDVSEKLAKVRMDEFIVDMLMDLKDVKDYEGFLTGTGNFREQIAVTAPYKGNRTSKKPIHYEALRKHLNEEWEFRIVDGMEADDAIAIMATSHPDKSIVCSIDKDFDQLPGWKYNFVKRIKYYVTPDDGLRSFYTQILTGDRIDNVIGLRGIGPVRAFKMLDGCSKEQEYYQAVLKAYGGDVERVVENGQLLWLKRSVDEPLWSPPIETKTTVS